MVLLVGWLKLEEKIVELEKLCVHECIEYDFASIVEILMLTNGIFKLFLCNNIMGSLHVIQLVVMIKFMNPKNVSLTGY